MKTKYLLGTIVLAATLAACDSGDITLAPTNIDNSNQGNTNNAPPAQAVNPCAKYEQSGQTFEGVYDGTNCTYESSFVSDTRPITVAQIFFPNFGGLHIFEDSLFVGQDVTETAANLGEPVPQEGQGTRLTIEAGNTMVFAAEDSYVRIARGSQIFAEGTAAEPITFTADEDAVLGAGTENDRGLWGGVQINGNGLTNKCHDGTETGNNPGGADQFAAPGLCHQVAEGRPSTYGGNNNAESSGVLTYVVIKHAGFEVVDGDELNALTLNAVGSGTTISHVQVYTTLDDGFEMFGGAVNLDHIVAVNVGDDSIDYSEGYTGDIQYAVVLHTSGANRCIEGDNTGGGRGDGVTPLTTLRISNMTCITSGIDENEGNNPSGKGSSEGPLFREGAIFEMYNSIVTSNDTTMRSNECFEIADSEGPETADFAQDGTSVAIANVFACTEAHKYSCFEDENENCIVNGNENFESDVWLAGGGAGQVPANTNADNVVDEIDLPYTNLITNGIGARGYLTAAGPITNSAGAQVFDPATQLFDAGDLGGIFETPTYLGGANAGDDWLAGWTVGFDLPLDPGTVD